jgi:hypothetical protein
MALRWYVNEWSRIAGMTSCHVRPRMTHVYTPPPLTHARTRLMNEATGYGLQRALCYALHHASPTHHSFPDSIPPCPTVCAVIAASSASHACRMHVASPPPPYASCTRASV